MIKKLEVKGSFEPQEVSEMVEISAFVFLKITFCLFYHNFLTFCLFYHNFLRKIKRVIIFFFFCKWASLIASLTFFVEKVIFEKQVAIFIFPLKIRKQ